MKNKDFKKTDKEIEKHFKESMKNILIGIDENKK